MGMSKASAVCFLVIVFVTVNANGFFQLGGLFNTSGVDFQYTALNSAATRIGSQNLPADLRDRLTDAVNKAENSFKSCDTTVYWQYRRCSGIKLREAMAELNKIENEAKSRRIAAAVV